MLAVVKPVTYSGAIAKGAVITFETSHTNATNVNGYIRNDNSNTPNAGWPTSPTDTEWANGSNPGGGIWVGLVSGIGNNTSPTISQLNNHPLITTYYHSAATGSWNDHHYKDGPSSGSVMSWDESTLTFSFTDGTGTISLSSNSTAYFDGATTSTSGVRTVGNDHNNTNVYINGILYDSQSGGSSGDSSGEWWEIQQTADADEQSTKYVASNNDNLIDTGLYFPRTDVTFVKKALTGAKTDDARDNALAYILAHLETNGDKKRLPQRYRKIRTSLNISSIETLENDYRTHSV